VWDASDIGAYACGSPVPAYLPAALSGGCGIGAHPPGFARRAVRGRAIRDRDFLSIGEFLFNGSPEKQAATGAASSERMMKSGLGGRP
jgi:hypothetical protein